MRLSSADLQQLRAELLEHRQTFIDSEHLPRVREYLKAQELPVNFSPAAAGIRIALRQSD